MKRILTLQHRTNAAQYSIFWKETDVLLEFAHPIFEHLGPSSSRHTLDRNPWLQDNKVKVNLIENGTTQAVSFCLEIEYIMAD